jgi:hypothetical protein
MRCEVCRTEREGMDNGPVHRRTLTVEDRSVVYCADVPECGEEAALFYLCPHEHWYRDEDRDGRQVRICEDCDSVIYESEVERPDRQEP